MTLMELLDSEVNIDHPSLILKHINHVLHHDKIVINWHMDFGLGISLISLMFQFHGRVQHSSLPESMQYANTPL